MTFAVPLELRPGHIQLQKEMAIHHCAIESIRSVLAVPVQIEELFLLAAHRFNNFVFKDSDSDFRNTGTDGDRHLFLRNTSQSPADRQRRHGRPQPVIRGEGAVIPVPVFAPLWYQIGEPVHELERRALDAAVGPGARPRSVACGRLGGDLADHQICLVPRALFLRGPAGVPAA